MKFTLELKSGKKVKLTTAEMNELYENIKLLKGEGYTWYTTPTYTMPFNEFAGGGTTTTTSSYGTPNEHFDIN